MIRNNLIPLDLNQLNNGPANIDENIENLDDTDFRMDQRGLYYFAYETKGKISIPSAKFICSKFCVVAKTRLYNSTKWGIQIEWQDPDKKTHREIIYCEELQGDGKEVRSKLSSGGLLITQNRQGREMLSKYLIHKNPEKRITIANKIGWYGQSYVLPNKTIGQTDNVEEFFSPIKPNPRAEFASKGTLQEWQANACELTDNNPKLILSVSASLAGTLLEPLGFESSGIHFRGESSKGKSTALELAASVWGNKDFIKSWRTTDNGLEAIAESRNDNILLLDEIVEGKSKNIEKSFYMLGNGQGKTRLSQNAEEKPIRQWRTIYISTGEISISSLLEKSYPGQEVRLTEISANDGTYGMFDDIHGFNTPSEFADRIKDVCKQYYGTAGISFIENFLKNRNENLDYVNNIIKEFTTNKILSNGNGIVRRIAKKFAFIGAVGELAIKLGITTWKSGTAKDAALKCFHSWHINYNGQYHDVIEFIHKFQYIIQTQVTRFELINENANTVAGCYIPPNRLGYRLNNPIKNDINDNECESPQVKYYIPPAIFKKDICEDSIDSRYALKMLLKVGILGNNDGKAIAKSKRVNGDNCKLYFITNVIDSITDEEIIAALDNKNNNS